MWLYIIFCITLFYAVKTQSNTPNNEPEEIFVDVIKNISRVNNVLQELISNYETLQKIYKSQENIDSSKYSDSGLDELFQDNKKEPRIQKSKATIKEKFAATEMYWSDHEENTKNDNDEYANQSKRDHKKKENFVDEDKNVVRLKSRISTTTVKPEKSSSSEYSSDSDESEENVLKEKIKRLPQYANEKKMEPISKSNKAQTGFGDSYGFAGLEKLLQPFTDKKSEKTRSRKIYKDKEKNANPGSKIPYLVLSDGLKEMGISKNTKKGKQNLSPRADNSKTSKTREEKFFSDAITTKKTFYDLLKNNPIQLEAHSEIFMENVKNPVTHSDKKYKQILRDKRRDIDKLSKTKGKHHHHQKEDKDQGAVNETHLNLLRTDNVKVANSNVTHHAKKSYKKIDDNTKNIYIDHKNASIDHETNNNNQKIGHNHKEARDTDNNDKKTKDDNKSGDIGNKKASNDHKKAKRDHKMINNNEEQRDKSSKSKKKKKLHKETQEPSSDESVFMDKNDTHVLREAYGEACMKVVVRKCYKACMRTSKNVCKQTKCKSALKSVFRGHVKTACIDKFSAREDQSQNLKSKLMDDGELFETKRRALQENYNNLNTGGFHVCLPTLSVQTEPTLKPSTNETKLSRRKMPQKTTDEKVSFNILRDRFEKACKKISYGKCHEACKSSWDSACTTHDCSKRLQTLYKKACKNSCKNAYGLVKHSKSSGSSGSDGSSSDKSSNSS